MLAFFAVGRGCSSAANSSHPYENPPPLTNIVRIYGAGTACKYGPSNGGPTMTKLLLIQGANLVWLGKREPEIYGTTSAAELDVSC
jgi:hypothetical protein